MSWTPTAVITTRACNSSPAVANLDFPDSPALSFLQVGLPVGFGLHGAGDARNDPPALRRGQRLLLHLHSFAFAGPLHWDAVALLFFGLNALNNE